MPSLHSTVTILVLATTLATVIAGDASPSSSDVLLANRTVDKELTNHLDCVNGVTIPGYSECMCFCGWSGERCNVNDWRGLEWCELPFAIPQPRPDCFRGFRRDDGSCHCVCGWTGDDCSMADETDSCEESFIRKSSGMEMKERNTAEASALVAPPPQPTSSFVLTDLLVGGIAIAGIIFGVLMVRRSCAGRKYHRTETKDKPLVDQSKEISPRWIEQDV